MSLFDEIDLAIAAHERSEARADRRRSAYPICICCGHSIFGCDTYREIGNKYLCGDCDSISEVGYTNDLEI